VVTRRVFATQLGLGALAAASRVSAQPARKPARMGWLSGGSAVGSSAYLDGFRDGLRDLGHAEGRSYVIEARWADGAPERIPALTEELVRLKVDLLVAQGPVARLVKQAAGTTPVVFGISADPVEGGIVASLARPGGTVTGRTFLAVQLVGKRLELLKEAVPGLSTVAIVANPDHAGEQAERRETLAAAQRLELTTRYLQARSQQELEAALAEIARVRTDGMVVFPDAVTLAHRQLLGDFALRRRIAAMAGWSQFAEAGALLTYGPNLRDEWRLVATQADRILKGARPADLPVEQSTRFELVVNLKTAQALGLAVPPTVLVRADRVIS
jgi:putative ABC transport system substrate-binding protein